MGYSISWLAIRQPAAQDVLAELGLIATASEEWLPESDIVGTASFSPWYIVVFNAVAVPALKTDSLRSLSIGRQIVACELSDTAMICDSCEWRDGLEVWALAHDASHGIQHLQVSGHPPAEFARIRSEQEAKQAAATDWNVDYIYEIPLEVAQSQTAFRHDSDFDEAESAPFVVLRDRD